MDHIWDKLDGYTKSDYLNSSDDENHEVYFKQTERLHISTKEHSQTEVVEDKSLCSEDVDTWTEETPEEKQERKQSLHENLLDEMKNSELHCNSETRNVQEKIDEMSMEKSLQKEEPNEMQHKAQVISKSARMSATDVLSTITSSETIDHEESGNMDEYYDRIRSTNTDDDPIEPEDSRENERKSPSSDVDLPNIHPISTTLNTGVMKSKANVARQGSMKARRKPTLMKRKSWTPGMNELDMREEDEMIVEDADNEEDGDGPTRTGSFTPSDSSSEEEKEVVKPHLRSGIALPGLGDALKIQMTRSELKRPTALNLVKIAKDVKDNEVSKEDKLETLPSKPEWMKEVEQRKKKPKTPQRRHKTLPARSSELDTLFEQRKQVQSTEALVPDSTGHEAPFVAREDSTSKSIPGEDIDPELQKMFERRKNLKPLELEDGTSEGVVKETERPKSFHGDQVDLELNKMFERRKNLKPMEVDNNTYGEGAGVKETERPKTFHGDQVDLELNKMFERRKNLQPVEGRSSNSEEGDQVFKPRNIHLQSSQATELDKIFEKRKQLRPVEGARPPTPEGQFHESPAVVSPPADLRQTSGIVRARFHDTKLEPLPGRGEVKVATVAEVEVRTARQVEEYRRPNSSKREIETSGAQVAQFVFDGRGATHGTVGRIPGQSGNSKHPRSPTPLEQGSTRHNTVAQFDDRGATRSSVGRITVGGKSGNFKDPHPPTEQRTRQSTTEAQVDGRGAARGGVDRILVGSQSGNSKQKQGNTGQDTTEAQVTQFDGRGVSHTTVSRLPSGGNQRSNGSFNATGQREHQHTSPEERSTGKGAQVAQFVFDGSAAASHATVGRIPLGANRGDHVIGAREGHVMASRGSVTDARDTNQVVTSPTSSKSDTRNFIEQLSHKPGGKTVIMHGVSQQGKFVATPSMGSRDNPPERIHPTNSKNEQGQWEPYMDKEYPIPNKSHHGVLLPHPHEGKTPVRNSQSTAHVPPSQEFLPRNLPPINTQYSTHPPSHSSNITPLLAQSLSYPQNSISQFQDHPPLNAKTFNPQVSYPQPVVHSPSTPKKARVTSPRSVRVREMKCPVREMDSDLRGGRVDFNLSGGNEVCMLYKVTSPAELWPGNSVATNESDIPRGRIAEGRIERPSRDLRSDTKQGVRLRNIELSTNIDRTSDSISNGPHHKEIGERMRRVQSPERFDDQKIQGHKNSDRLSDEWSNKVQSHDRSDDHKIRRAQNPDSTGDQRINRVRSPDRSDGQGINRVRSPDRTSDRSSDKSDDQKINRIRSPDRPGDQMINRIRSPDRSGDERINRIRSPDRSGDQRMNRIRSPERSGDERINRIRSPDRSGDQRIRDGHALRERGRTKKLPSNYQSPVDEERRTDNRLRVKTSNEFNSKPNTNTIDPITNGMHNNRDLDHRTGGITSSSGHASLLNRESGERPKHVTVTVKSLSESPVYVKSPVGRVRPRERDNTVYGNGECVVNGLVNGGGRGRWEDKTLKETLDIQSSESPAIPKWKQELREKKRLQKEKQLGENSSTVARQKDTIQPEQSGNDIAEWQKRLQGIRKKWGNEESDDKDSETTSQADHVIRPDVDEENNVPGFLKEFQQKKMNQDVKDDKQDTETYV